MNSNEDYLDQLLNQMKSEENSQVEEDSVLEKRSQIEEPLIEESSQAEEIMQLDSFMTEEDGLNVASDTLDEAFNIPEESTDILESDVDDLGIDIDDFASQMERDILDSQVEEESGINFDSLLEDSENEDEKAILELLKMDEKNEIIEQPEPDKYEDFDVMAAINGIDDEESVEDKRAKKGKVKKGRRKKVAKEKKTKEKVLRSLFHKEKASNKTETRPIEKKEQLSENPFDDIDKVFEESQTDDAVGIQGNDTGEISDLLNETTEGTDIMDMQNGTAEGTDITDMLNGTAEGTDITDILNGTAEGTGISDIFNGTNNDEQQIDGLEDDYLQALLGDVNAEDKTVSENWEKTKETKHKKKKKGLLERIIDALTETEEENDQEELGIILSEENQEILRTLEDKDEAVKGKKKKKNKKDSTEEDEDKKEKKDKKEKRKEKKEKKPKKTTKLSEVDLTPSKKLSKRRVLLIFLMCITFCLVLILLITVGIDVSVKNTAIRAYQQGDYETCYENLKGKNLTESQRVMYGKSESILRIRLWVREYEFFKEQGEEENALDILLLSVRDYPTLYQFSSQYNATDEVAQNYDKILDSLNSEYGIDEDTAKKIVHIPDDVIYTKIVKAIVAGQDFQIYMDNNSDDSLTEDLSDYLSEEEEFNNDSNN